MRWIAALALVLFTAGCNEVAPENKAGGENNPFPTLSIPASGSIQQPSEGNTLTYSVQVSFSGAAPSDGGFRIRTANGSAQAGTHFESLDQQVSFSEGQRTAVVDIEILHDPEQQSMQQEVDFTVSLASAQNAYIGDSADQLVTITPRQSEQAGDAPVLNLTNLSLRAPGSGRAEISYPIVFSLSERVSANATVEIQTREGTAVADTHFTALDETLTIPAGSREVSFDLELLRDGDMRESKSFELVFMSANGIELPVAREVEVTLLPNDPDPSPADPEPAIIPELLMSGVTSLWEPESGTKTYQLLFPFSTVAEESGSVRIRTFDSSAISGTNFQAFDEEFDFSEGDSSIVVPVTVINDGVVVPEGELQFYLQLLDSHRLELPDDRELEITILDRDSEPDPVAERPELQLPGVVSIPSPSSVASRTYSIWFQLSEPAQEDSSFRVSSRAGTAQDGINFDSFNYLVTIDEGESEARVQFDVLRDSTQSSTLEFEVVVSEASKIQLPSSRSMTVEINPGITDIPELNVPETTSYTAPDNGETKTISIPVPFSNNAVLDGDVVLNIHEKDAREGTHYENVPGTVAFSKGDFEIEINLDLLGVGITENREFEIIFVRGNNIVLPDEHEDRRMRVIILPAQ